MRVLVAIVCGFVVLVLGFNGCSGGGRSRSLEGGDAPRASSCVCICGSTTSEQQRACRELSE